MAQTLLEAAKRGMGTVLDAAVARVFAREASILRVLPFRNIAGNAIKYTREQSLPGIGFRGVNESYSESTGIINPIIESLSISGGDIKVDKFLVDTENSDERSVQEGMKIAALAQDWQRAFFKGDSEVDPREFDGLQKRIVGAQLISNGNTAGGDPLSLLNLDIAIGQCIDAMFLAMSRKMRIRLTAAARDTAVGGYVTFEQDEFGRRLSKYDDIPILEIEDAAGDDTVLTFTEAGEGGGTTSTSIYVMGVGEGKLVGLQNGNMQARDLGELQTEPAFLTRVEWYSGFAIYHPKSVVRLYGISDAAAVK